ncbi:MAG: pyridoxamine 5'-phosphate oxidase family protein [Myxococcaceae bacterium]
MGKECTAVEELRKQLKGIRFTMLTTEDSEGYLRSRPMAAQDLDDEGNLWFFTGKSAPKVGEIARHQQVNLSYVNDSDNRFVSVSGSAEVVDDRPKAKELWSPILKAWFPDGLDDPNLTLLRVKVEQAEYWDVVSSKLVQIAGFLKAIVTGQQANGGRHGHLEMGGASY